MAIFAQGTLLRVETQTPGTFTTIPGVKTIRSYSFLGFSSIYIVFKDDVELPSSITMSLSHSQVVFVYGPVELISRTIDEQYPDYKQIIPSNFQTQAVVDRDDFIKAVKTASLFSKTGLFDVNLAFDPDTKQLSVSATDATRGANTTHSSADITGVNNSVTVNYRYLLDGLQASLY